jgi:hypothetical protein
MKKALIVLALLITSLGLKAEESQLPFKVGDRVELTELLLDSKQQPKSISFVVKEVKGKWVNCGTFWINSDLYIIAQINKTADEDTKKDSGRK